jgi:class 3 adenylate cyclase
MAVTVVIVFLFTIMMFLIYDRLVERRQTMVLNKAVQSSAIVSSLFPRMYADRLLQQNNSGQFSVSTSYSSNNKRLKSFLIGDNETNENEQPIADLFPFATVLFADIAGFTAWSSTREPVQVFILLQRLYQAFDGLAQKRKVFKVETIGDSYVAVTGVPEPQRHHALIMARFARDIQKVVLQITLNLGLSLGPDTCDLRMRIGMHSGPVTAGVLRGERARFQLFGDTVNTASRMER